MKHATDFEIGDLVFVGKPAPLTEKATWRIQAIREEGGTRYAYLSSGLTDRARREPLARLTHFQLMEKTA